MTILKKRKKDRRIGNSGRNPAEDPKQQVNFYIPASWIEVFGDYESLRTFAYGKMEKEVKKRKKKKIQQPIPTPKN